MKRTLIALFAVAALAACNNNPADDVPAATVQDSPAEEAAEGEAAPTEPATADEEPAPEAEAPAAGTLALTPENTSLTFVGSKVTASHDGGWEQFSGTLATADGQPAGGSVELTFQMATIFADRDRLTQHLRSDDFFDVANHPTASFTSTSVVAAEAANTYTVTGDLVIKGVTKTISFPATIEVVGDQISASAEFAINRQDWGINYRGMPDDLIRDEVVIRFNITGPLG